MGNPVILDHVLHDRDMLASCQKAFNGLTVFSVGVVCPLDILEARERARGDRAIGVLAGSSMWSTAFAAMMSSSTRVARRWTPVLPKFWRASPRIGLWWECRI
jgi:chloramphenicol 3-O-phosphotransferase